MIMCNRGDIVLIDLKAEHGASSEKSVALPALVVSSDTLNANLDTVLVCPIIEANSVSDSKTGATFVPHDISGLGRNCIVFSFQIRSISKKRILRRMGSLPESYLKDVKEGLVAALELE